jgi:recombination protein RecA
LGQGREAAKTFLKDNADIYAQIEKKVKEKAGLIPTASTPALATSASGASPAPAPAPKAVLEPSAVPVVAMGSKEKTETKVEVKKETAFVPTEKAKLALKK